MLVIQARHASSTTRCHLASTPWYVVDQSGADRQHPSSEQPREVQQSMSTHLYACCSLSGTPSPQARHLCWTVCRAPG